MGTQPELWRVLSHKHFSELMSVQPYVCRNSFPIDHDCSDGAESDGQKVSSEQEDDYEDDWGGGNSSLSAAGPAGGATHRNESLPAGEPQRGGRHDTSLRVAAMSTPRCSSAS